MLRGQKKFPSSSGLLLTLNLIINRLCLGEVLARIRVSGIDNKRGLEVSNGL